MASMFILDNFIKIIYYDNDHKRTTFYVPSKCSMFDDLINTVTEVLSMRITSSEEILRIYWIDEEGDIIQMLNQTDYDIFLAKSGTKQQLHIAAASQDFGEISEKFGLKDKTIKLYQLNYPGED